MSFNKLDFNFKPLHIESDNIKSNLRGINGSEQDSIDIAQKLLDHLDLINQFEERIKAIDYLIDGAEKLAGNPTYLTDNKKLISNISDIGGTGNKVDFALFKKSIDLIIQSYDNLTMSIVAGQTHD